MCDVLSYRCDHLVRPFLGKKWENILKQHEQKGIRIHSKSLAYRRDSCSNDFDLIPKQEKIREVLIEEEEETLLIYTAQGSPFRRKKLSVINGSPEQQRTKTH